MGLPSFGQTRLACRDGDVLDTVDGKTSITRSAENREVLPIGVATMLGPETADIVVAVAVIRSPVAAS